MAQAQYNLGYMYHNGQGVPQDYAEAVKWYRKAADQGYRRRAVQPRLHVRQRPRRAAGLRRGGEVVSQGGRPGRCPGAVQPRRTCTSNGQGVPQDYAEAVKWYRKAADQGYAAAQTNLGLMYAHGQGVPQDYVEAVKWYRKAADQG